LTRRPLSIAGGTLAAAVLSACSPAGLLSQLYPVAPGGEVRDIQYAPGPRHALDIYLPGKVAIPPPVIVYFYGGGWTAGDRASYRFVGRSLAACGAITIIPDYRVWPAAGFPEFLKDAAASVAFARLEAARRGGDLARLFLMGHSAGAYIATMLALDPEWLAAESIDARAALAGVVGLAGPYDFLPLHDPVLKQIFAPEGPRTQPIAFAANATAPLLLMTGAVDTIVNPDNSTGLAARVREFGGDAQATLYSGVGHVGIVAALAAPLRFLAPVRNDVCRFMGLAETARDAVR
jgi:acetyl esterase/lipase